MKSGTCRQAIGRTVKATLVVVVLVVSSCGSTGSTTDTALGSQDPDTTRTADRTDGEEHALDEPTSEPKPEASAEPEPEASTEPTTKPKPSPTPAPTAAPVPTATPEPVVEATENPPPYAEYIEVMDDEGAIEVEIPVEWSDVDGRKFFDDNGLEFFDITAAPDIEAYGDTWDVPGIRITASRDLALTSNETALADAFGARGFRETCTYEGRDPYDDGLYEGVIEIYGACDGTETSLIYIAAVPTHRSFIIQVLAQIVDERDIDAMVRAIETYVIIDEGAVTGTG